MAECAAAGLPPGEFFDYTYRMIAALLEGAKKREIREHQLHLWAQYQGQALSRTKRLPNIATLLRKLEPNKPMSGREIRHWLMEAARQMGAKVTRRKKGEA